jgi:hypothetical protein
MGVGVLGAGASFAAGVAHLSRPREALLPLVPIVDRAGWGGVEPNIDGSVEGRYDGALNPSGWMEYAVPLSVALKNLILHHTATGPEARVADIQAMHMRTRGYADIGYHYLIGADGVIAAGRPVNVRGAHTGGHNTGSIGVALIGNFEQIAPTDAQLISLGRLAQALINDFWLARLGGHRDFQPGATVCPGANFWPQVPVLAERLGVAYGPG